VALTFFQTLVMHNWSNDLSNTRCGSMDCWNSLDIYGKILTSTFQSLHRGPVKLVKECPYNRKWIVVSLLQVTMHSFLWLLNIKKNIYPFVKGT
jgi:hypothetical protein